jgi:hypothetical protein
MINMLFVMIVNENDEADKKLVPIVNEVDMWYIDNKVCFE